jgi:hypothetical protein
MTNTIIPTPRSAAEIKDLIRQHRKVVRDAARQTIADAEAKARASAEEDYDARLRERREAYIAQHMAEYRPPEDALEHLQYEPTPMDLSKLLTIEEMIVLGVATDDPPIIQHAIVEWLHSQPGTSLVADLKAMLGPYMPVDGDLTLEDDEGRAEDLSSELHAILEKLRSRVTFGKHSQVTIGRPAVQRVFDRIISPPTSGSIYPLR